jgi:hypothetical protein
VFADQLRLETALPIARDLNRDGPVVGEHRLATRAIAMIRGEIGFRLTGRIPKMVRELGP